MPQDPEPTAVPPEMPTESEVTAETTIDIRSAEKSWLRQRLPVIVTSAAIALLALTVTVATVGYVQTKDDLAARTAERDRIAKELAESRTQRTELEAKLKATEAKVLDPKGYESIKSCVKRGSGDEQAMRSMPGAKLFRLPVDTLPPDLLENAVPLEPSQGETEELKYPCIHGEPYLK